MFNSRCYDNSMFDNMNQNSMAQEYPDAVNMNQGSMPYMNAQMVGNQCTPIYECPQERVCHREFVHEVPQE